MAYNLCTGVTRVERGLRGARNPRRIRVELTTKFRSFLVESVEDTLKSLHLEGDPTEAGGRHRGVIAPRLAQGLESLHDLSQSRASDTLGPPEAS